MCKSSIAGAMLILAIALSTVPLRADEPHPAQPAASGPAATAHPPAGDHAAADGHGSANIFSGGIGNMIWTTIVFLIVVYILGTKAWPVLMRSLSEREATIRASLEKAREERLAAENLLKQYAAQLDRARVEATAIVEEGRRDAEGVRRRIQEEARNESNETIARAKREIQLATDAAVTELYDRTAELAIQVAAGVLRKQLSLQDQGDLVRQAMAEIKAGKTSMN